jgi:hypothetical protein
MRVKLDFQETLLLGGSFASHTLPKLFFYVSVYLLICWQVPVAGHFLSFCLFTHLVYIYPVDIQAEIEK